MAPNGRRAWSHPAGARGAPERSCGSVVAIAWAPDGFRIAYVVRTSARRFVLHVIWGNGTHDTVIDRSVRAVRPSWRAGLPRLRLCRRRWSGDRLRRRAPVASRDPAGRVRRRPAWRSRRAGRPRDPDGNRCDARRPASRGPLARPASGLDWLGTRLVVALRGQTRLRTSRSPRFYSVGRRVDARRAASGFQPVVATHGRKLASYPESVLVGRLESLAAPCSRHGLSSTLPGGARTRSRASVADRLARPDGYRDVPRRRRDLHRPEAVEIAGPRARSPGR